MSVEKITNGKLDNNNSSADVDQSCASLNSIGTSESVGIRSLNTLDFISSSMLHSQQLSQQYSQVSETNNNYNPINVMDYEAKQNAAATTLSQLTDASDSGRMSCTHGEIQKMMNDFDAESPSTHIFLKPTKGTLHRWEHESRKYFYLKLVYKLIPDQCLKNNKRLGKNITCKDLSDIYKVSSGMKTLPPFYSYNKTTKMYDRMSEIEITSFMGTLFQKIGRLKKCINNLCDEKDKFDKTNKEGEEEEEEIEKDMTVSPNEIVGLCYDVAKRIPYNKRKELYDMIVTFKKNNCD